MKWTFKNFVKRFLNFLKNVELQLQIVDKVHTSPNEKLYTDHKIHAYFHKK